MILTLHQFDELVAHARAEAPNECCGFLRLAGDQVVDVVRGRNVRASAATYELDTMSLLAAADHADAGEDIALYHSHLQTPAEPSPNDVRFAFHPWRYVIVSIAADPEIRAWWVQGGQVSEDPVVIEA